MKARISQAPWRAKVVAERQHHRFAQRARPPFGEGRLRREQRHRDAGDHAHRHDAVHRAEGQPVSEYQSAAARQQHAQPVSIHVHRSTQPQFRLRQAFAAIGVDDNVL
jgi:hypothetical protein